MNKPIKLPYLVNTKGATAPADARANNAANRTLAEEMLERREAEKREAAANAAAKAFKK